MIPQTAPQDRAAIEFFERDIRPVLASRCYECHSSRTAQPRGGLRLDSAAGWNRGGKAGSAVKPGDPKNSLLIKAIDWKSSALHMPPTGRLPDVEIAALTSENSGSGFIVMLFLH